MEELQYQDEETNGLGVFRLFTKIQKSSLLVEHEKRTTFLGFTTSVEVWHDTKEFIFSDKQSEFLKVHFTNKAIKAFESMHTSRGLVSTVVDFFSGFLY